MLPRPSPCNPPCRKSSPGTKGAVPDAVAVVTSLVFNLMLTKLVLVSFLAVGGQSSSQLHISVVEEEPKEKGCPPCELFFHKLDKNEETGNLAQVVRVQERGEPKSGTGMMFDWATGALDQMCKHLQLLYGEVTCLSVQAGSLQMIVHSATVVVLD